MDYFASGPIVAMVWEGPEVILTGRKMLGATNPNSSEPGSILYVARGRGQIVLVSLCSFICETRSGG